MDINAAMGQFFDENGQIAVPDALTLAGMNEMLFGAAKAQGEADKVLYRYWDYNDSAEGVLREYTREEINTRIKAVCVRLQQVTKRGDRVAILANNSPEYVYSFLGIMYAGLVPVPLYDPTEPGHADHLTAVLDSSTPVAVMTNKRSATAVREFFADRPAPERPRVLVADALPDSLAEQWQNPAELLAKHPELAPKSSDEAFLQYTSGSTRTPAGVVLTHKSIVTNVLQIFIAVKLQPPVRIVSWLPLHHDMGLILATFASILGLPFDLMSPRDFLQNPARWIKQLDKRDDEENIYTVVPNFALELATRYANPADEANAELLAGLDLSRVDGLVNGSEPVTHASVERFLDLFANYQLRRDTMRPSYGLAEASLLVTTPQTDKRPWTQWFDREQLAGGAAVALPEGDEAAMPLTSVGQVCPWQSLCIVDPETGKELADGQVGELWINGENTATGYLNREEETTYTFRNHLPADHRLPENSRAGKAPEDNWMRTGDLGVIVDDQVFITGRLKDLVIVAGRNHYPQDIEETAAAATSHISHGAVAAFAVPGAELGQDVEGLVLLAERAPEASPVEDGIAANDIRAAVSKVHGLKPADIRIVDAGNIPRSSANKIARRVAAKAYTQGQFN